MDIKEAIQNAEIFQNIAPSTFGELVSFGTLKRVKRGDHLFRDQEKVIFVYGRGKVLNEVIINGLPASVNCEILGGGLILCFPRDRLLAVMESDFGLAKAVMDSMSMKICGLYRQMKNTTNSVRGDKRIAAKLWKLSVDHGVPCKEGGRIDLELTITYLADMMGSKRETVLRQLKTLCDAGLVIFQNGSFIVTDGKALGNYFKAP